MNNFSFYILYKGEYNFDLDIGISRENVKRLQELLEKCDLPDGVSSDFDFLSEIKTACEEILEEVNDDDE